MLPDAEITCSLYVYDAASLNMALFYFQFVTLSRKWTLFWVCSRVPTKLTCPTKLTKKDHSCPVVCFTFITVLCMKMSGLLLFIVGILTKGKFIIYVWILFLKIMQSIFYSTTVFLFGVKCCMYVCVSFTNLEKEVYDILPFVLSHELFTL